MVPTLSIQCWAVRERAQIPAGYQPGYIYIHAHWSIFKALKQLVLVYDLGSQVFFEQVKEPAEELSSPFMKTVGSLRNFMKQLGLNGGPLDLDRL
jgi:hypothetical protein